MTERGYLENEDGYLAGDYMAGEIETAFGMQVQMVVGAQPSQGMQALMAVSPDLNLGAQVLLEVKQDLALAMQVYAESDGQALAHMQAQLVILNQSKSLGMEALADTLRHALLEVYLTGGYLEEQYLVAQMGAYMGMQVLAEADAEKNLGMQVQGIINAEKHLGQQALMIVDTKTSRGMQANRFSIFRPGMQATMVIYNTTAFRIMSEFPSRGTAALGGNNWTASSTATGEYYPKNLNTDIIEQVYRSAAGTASLVTLTCDTGVPQGVPIDTIAILGHNLTRSALVQVQGSNDNFATTNITFNMTTELENMYYISPEFPSQAGQNRYWRFIIQDSTNPAGYVQIGAIVFGTSDIFSLESGFLNPVVTGYRHFKDELKTEGFTAVSNDRALKRFLRLQFSELNFFRANYRILDDHIRFARTSLKSLVIPTPEYPSRFAVFGKLSAMPEINHNDIDETTGYIALDLEWDESL